MACFHQDDKLPYSEAEVCLGVPFKAIIRVLVLDAIEIFRLLPGTGLQL